MLFADLLSLHLVTFLMFFILVNPSMARKAGLKRDWPGREGLAARLMLHLPYYVSLQFTNFLPCELDDGSMYELMI